MIGALGLLLMIVGGTGPVRAADLDEQFRGLVYPSKQVELTAPLPGVLKAIQVEEGQGVQADQVLVQLDDALQKVAVEAAKMKLENETDIQHAKLELDQAQMMLDRIQEVAKQGAAKEWEVRRTRVQRDLAKVNYDAAQRDRELARINLDAELERLERYQLKAPFDGRIIRRLAEPGATLTETDKILVLYALDPLEARLFLPSHLFGKLEVGHTYKLLAGEPINTELVGTLKTVDTVIDPASETFRCAFTIDNPEATLPSGFTVHLLWPQESVTNETADAQATASHE